MTEFSGVVDKDSDFEDKTHLVEVEDRKYI